MSVHSTAELLMNIWTTLAFVSFLVTEMLAWTPPPPLNYLNYTYPKNVRPKSREVIKAAIAENLVLDP